MKKQNSKTNSAGENRFGFRQFLFLMLMLICSSGAMAQKVSGNVVDAATGEGIIGASIVVKGTGKGTVTDFNGNFVINGVASNATLNISYVGYQTQSIALNGRKTINVKLEEDKNTLSEVVVVGYGVQKKSDVTGALAHLDSKDLTTMPVNNALEAMQGKTAGVDISNSQRPGEVGDIQIRGVRSIGANNKPLYVVDGMVIQNGGIENINPQDIESIEVLKDASATAVYGSRGANGVILVTTKKGKEGKVTLNYAGAVTFTTMHDVADYMNAAEWLDYSRRAKYNMGAYGDATQPFAPNYDADKKAYGSVAASWANIEKAWEGGTYDASKVGSYDWTDEGKRTGFSQEHTLSASGGTEKFKGYGSFGYLQDRSTQPGQEYKRYTVNTSFEATPLAYFTMGVSANMSYSHQDYGYNFSKSVTGAGDYYGALRGMLPWTVPFDENGDYIRNPNGDVNIINPINELQYNTNQRRTFRVNGSLYGEVNFGKIWKPLEGLRYRLQFGPEMRYYSLGIANAAEGINGDGNNVAQENKDTYRSWTLDNLVWYNRDFNKIHSVGLTLMQSASRYHYDRLIAKANVATATELWYNLSSNGNASSFGSELRESSMTSYMIRGNYTLMDRYMLTASIRWDGSSVLSEGHKWASFPSVALGWRIDQEDFMKNVSWVKQLKLRLGWGITGNSAISAYGTKGAIETLYYNWSANESVAGNVPSDPSAKSPNKMANLGLGWEKTTQYNVGLDYAFINGRIGGSIDVYKTKTDDLLLPMSIPSLTGYTQTYANVGRTEGWGIDLQLTAIPVKTKDFEWSTTLTWSMDRDEIKELSNGRTEDVNSGWFVGESIGSYYDYVYDGIWKTSEAEEAAKYGRKPGQIKVRDLNHDDKIDATNDRQIVGKARPDWSGGWRNTFTYKNFELSCFIVSRWGFDVRAGALTLDGRYMMRKVDYFIAGENENAEYYAPGSNGEAADTYSSSMNYQDGSYIKVRNISLGYNFTAKQLAPLGLGSMKVYVQAKNPFSIYRATDWLDTDLVNYSNNTRSFASEVTLRSWVIGLNIGF